MPTKSLLVGFVAVMLCLSMGGVARACQYCRLAATDPEAARMAAQIHSGGFPLDATINQFQGIAPTSTLSAPPAPDSVVTNAIDLPVPTARLHTAPIPVPPALVQPVTTVPVIKAASKPVRWSDAGLLGLATMGGLFCWCTRRVSTPVA